MGSDCALVSGLCWCAELADGAEARVKKPSQKLGPLGKANLHYAEVEPEVQRLQPAPARLSHSRLSPVPQELMIPEFPAVGDLASSL